MDEQETPQPEEKPQRPGPTTVLEWLKLEGKAPDGRNFTILQRITELFCCNGGSFQTRLYPKVLPNPAHAYGRVGLNVHETIELQRLYGTLVGFYLSDGFASETVVQKLAQEEIERAKKGIYKSPAKRIIVPGRNGGA